MFRHISLSMQRYYLIASGESRGAQKRGEGWECPLCCSKKEGAGAKDALFSENGEGWGGGGGEIHVLNYICL